MPQGGASAQRAGVALNLMTMLNNAQQRVVSTMLQRLERILADQERLLNPEPPLSLNQRVLDIDDVSIEQLRSLTVQAGGEIRQITRICGIRPTRESVRRTLQGSLSVLWADLEDTRPQKLIGYGGVSPEAMAMLGPPIDRLITLVRAMQAALNDNGS